MKTTFLEFEQPIAELEGKIEQLRFVQDDSAVDISDEIGRLESKSVALLKEVLQQADALANRHSGTPSAAPLHFRLHRAYFYRLCRVAR